MKHIFLVFDSIKLTQGSSQLSIQIDLSFKYFNQAMETVNFGKL